jgi:hypothetical protein
MSETTTDDEQSANDYYLPGASISTDPGPIERFLTRLFRRRGQF